MVYRDSTPISPKEPEYDKTKVDKRVANYTRQVREKLKGKDTREAMARAEEISSIVASEADERSKNTEHRQTVVEKQFDDQIRNMTLKDPSSAEMVAGRTNAKTGENWSTIGRRLDEEQDKINSQLTQTEEKIESFVNVKDFGAKADWDGSTGTNDALSFNQASLKAQEIGGVLLIPDGDFFLDDEVIIKTDVLCIGTIHIRKKHSDPIFRISPELTKIQLDTQSVTGLAEGSTKIGGLPTGNVGGTLVVLSNEILIERYHDTSVFDPYVKKDASVISSDDGTITPPLDSNYENSQIQEIFIKPKEKTININGLKLDVNLPNAVNRDIIRVEKNNVNFNDLIINNSGEIDYVHAFMKLVDCSNIIFNNANISGAKKTESGYGVNINNTAFVTFNDCKILDCKHALTGRHAKNVIINGGSYSEMIDCHWGINYTINHPEIDTLGNNESAIQYSGKDIVINGPKIRNAINLLTIRRDTPELSGRVEIKSADFETDADFVRLLDSGSTPNIVDNFFSREIKLPDIVVIDDNKIDAPVSSPIYYVQLSHASNYKHKPVKKIVVRNNLPINNNQTKIYLEKDTRFQTNVDYNPIVNVDNENFNGSSSFSSIQIARRDVALTDNWGYKLTLNNCTKTSFQINALAIKEAIVNNGSVIKYDSSSRVVEMDDMGTNGFVYFNRVYLDAAQVYYAKFIIRDCILSGINNIQNNNVILAKNNILEPTASVITKVREGYVNTDFFQSF